MNSDPSTRVDVSQAGFYLLKGSQTKIKMYKRSVLKFGGRAVKPLTVLMHLNLVVLSES